MFENTNQEMVREIADETMKVHRLRNIMATIAIELTAILITVLCGMGIGAVLATIKEKQMNPGQKMTLNLIVLRDRERVEEPVDGNFVDKKCIRDRI